MTYCLETLDLIDQQWRRNLNQVDTTMFILASILLFFIFVTIMLIILWVLIKFHKINWKAAFYTVRAELMKYRCTLICFYSSFFLSRIVVSVMIFISQFINDDKQLFSGGFCWSLAFSWSLSKHQFIKKLQIILSIITHNLCSCLWFTLGSDCLWTKILKVFNLTAKKVTH